MTPLVIDRTPIDLAQMMQRIAVQRPYFAFDALYQDHTDDWDLWGDFTPEQPLGREVEPLAVAEAGRHLAILGSCAAALTQHSQARTYYFACAADWRRYDHPPLPPGPLPLQARARVQRRCERLVTVNTELLQGKQLIGQLQVVYQVLSVEAFDGIFARQRNDEVVAESPSPYTEEFPLVHLASSSEERIACSGEFSLQRCAGHFPGYPMWPVALVIYGLSQLNTRLLEQRLQRPVRYTVVGAQVQARKLVAATEQLTFNAQLLWLAGDEQSCSMLSSASYGGQEIARFETLLALH